MAVAIDASSPAKVAQTSISATVTTASFTPPAGALLVALSWCSQNAANMTMAITDTTSRTWTKAKQRNSANSGGYQSVASIDWAVATGAAMTVTATVSGSFFPTLKVLVLTGADTSSPIGSTWDQGSTSTSFTTTGYTNTAAGGMGLICACNNAANLVTSNNSTYENGPASNGHYGMYGYKNPLGAVGASTTHHLECSGTVGMHVVQVEIKPLTSVDYAITATFAGAGSLGAAATRVRPDSPSFAGAGALTANATTNLGIAASFAGAGSMTSDGRRVRPGAFTGEGDFDLTAELTRVRPAQVDFVGAGSMNAVAADIFYSGAGLLVANANSNQNIAATFAGAGALSGAGDRVRLASITWTGSGLLGATTTRTRYAAGAFAGSGIMLVTLIRTRFGAAAFAGAGLMTIDGTRLGPTLATRVAPAKALSGAPVAGSRVTWEQSDSGVEVLTSINNALTWDVVAASGDPVPGLMPGGTSVRAVLSKVVLTREHGDDPSPWIDKLRVDVDEDDTTVEYVPLGVFDFEDAQISDDQNGIEIQLTGLDLSSRIAAYAWESIFTQPKDKNLGDVLKAVISDRYPAAQFNFVSTEATAPATLTFGARDENNPWQDCLDVAEKCGCELFVDAYGVFTLRPEPDPEVGDPVWTFTDRAKTVMTKLVRRLTKSETKNYIVVTGESSGNTVPARGVAYDDDPTSASYYLGRLGKRVLRITSKLIGDDNAAIVYARAQLLRRKNLTETVSIEAITNAAVQESDIVKVDRAASKLFGNFLIDRMRVPFKADTMTIEARRQRLAGSTPVGGGVGGLNGDEGSSGGNPDPATTAFKVAFTSCCNASDSTAYTDIKNENPDYFFHLGDVWYDDGGSGHVAHWNAQMGATNFAALLAALPNPPLIGWSDHDFGFANNAVGSGNSITATANSAYRTKFGTTGLPANGIYRTWTRGRVRFIYLDQLTFKSPLGTSSSTSRTMLGSTQKSWLKGLLADSAFPLIVIIGDGQWGGPAEDGQDEWRGYDAERKELRSAFQASPATIIALEGDTHSLAYAHDLYGIDRVWRASPINNNTKVKAAGADYTETYPTNANEDDTNKHKHYGIIDFTDDNNSITVTFRGFGDGALQMTDTISISAPGGTGGGSVPPASSVGALLKIGSTSGYNKVNVGVGLSAGSHTDYTQSAIEGGLNIAGYFELATGGTRAKLSAHLDGGTTPGSSYPRTEFRELELDGVTKKSFDPDSGTHYVKMLARLTKRPPNRPNIVLLQAHDASDDTAQLRVEGSNVKATINGTTVATLSTSFAMNTDYYMMIKIVGSGSASTVAFYWGTTEAALTTAAYTSGSANRTGSWYLKCGAYGQSNSSYDSVSDGPFIVEVAKFEMWHTGYPTALGWS